MRGIVYDISSGKVLYKFDTPTLPAPQAGEAIKQRDDIDSIQAGAIYDPGTDTYTNPAPVPVRDWKAEFAAAATATEKIALIAERLALK